MCKIICNITYSCGHTEPWVSPRSSQIDADGARKRGEKDPMCLIPGHCWVFGNVRQIKLIDTLLCTTCFVAQTRKRKDVSAEQRAAMISKAKRDADFHSSCARKHIVESEERSQLDEVDISRISEATDVAVERLGFSFSDAQMQSWHFEDLLQVVIGLPFLDKDRLVGKFASEAEKKFGAADVKWFYELSTTNRNFGDSFRKGLKNPDVLDEP